MLILFVSVEGKPGNKITFDPSHPVEGYYQTLGVTAQSEAELRTLIQDYLSSDLGSTLVTVSDYWVPDFEGKDADIKDEIGDLNNIGIWYSSGRAWFGPDDSD